MERQLVGEGGLGEGPGNVALDGMFSIQVLSHALEPWGLTVVSLESEEARDVKAAPLTATAFICNLQEHWFTLRKVDASGDWWNFNSLFPAPQPLSTFYLQAFLDSLRAEGWTIFVVRGKLPATLPGSLEEHPGGPGRWWEAEEAKLATDDAERARKRGRANNAVENALALAGRAGGALQLRTRGGAGGGGGGGGAGGAEGGSGEGDDDEDADLAAAIAASLEGHGGAGAAAGGGGGAAGLGGLGAGAGGGGAAGGGGFGGGGGGFGGGHDGEGLMMDEDDDPELAMAIAASLADSGAAGAGTGAGAGVGAGTEGQAEQAGAAGAGAAARAATPPPLPPVPAAPVLEAEPEEGEGVIEVAFRLPGGSRASRRFRLAQPASQLFAFVAAQTGLAAGGLGIMTQFPRKELPPSDSTSLSDLGLTHRTLLVAEPRA
ncbi:hypothetical protein HYH03_017891 [Edaphochlamys debaryana]|uniref:ubiquitinyl hydrolase 1 n=1 Tax=Edaphochlamys debaryana TaxID=47281 RepID=A0A836BPZ6_9CHLO|nr:hypothetical protein HYH03_017891 [Edaphochlamys debaryana]|eukprot:KAG2483234.1 hypothetical protein HYH03_017891 [Edaphochlamys debaryana]